MGITGKDIDNAMRALGHTVEHSDFDSDDMLHVVRIESAKLLRYAQKLSDAANSPTYKKGNAADVDMSDLKRIAAVLGWSWDYPDMGEDKNL